MKLQRIPEAALKASALAALWSCSSQFIRQQIQAGELEGVKLGRDWVVPVAAANRFWERRRAREVRP